MLPPARIRNLVFLLKPKFLSGLEHMELESRGRLKSFHGRPVDTGLPRINHNHAVPSQDTKTPLANNDGRGLSDADSDPAGLVEHNPNQAVHPTTTHEMLIDDQVGAEAEPTSGGSVAGPQSLWLG